MAFQPHPAQALPNGPRYYFLRGNAMVPLVPVDQLPFQLHGIPCELNHRQMSDESWKFLEVEKVDDAPCIISVKAHIGPTVRSQYLAPDHAVRAESQRTPTETSQTKKSSCTPSAALVDQGTSRPVAATDSERQSTLNNSSASIVNRDVQRIEYHLTYPSGIRQDMSKKEYCTHWLRTGECDWTTIGCKFKHEIPPPEKLREVGFANGLSPYWKKKSAIAPKGCTWLQRNLDLANEDGEQHITKAPVSRTFPDLTTRVNARIDQSSPSRGGVPHSRRTHGQEAVLAESTKLDLPTVSASLEVVTHPSSENSNLIDLNNIPTLLPSLGRSTADSASTIMTSTPSSYCSGSPPLSPSNDIRPTLVTACKLPLNFGGGNRGQDIVSEPFVRQPCLVSPADEHNVDIISFKPTPGHDVTPGEVLRRAAGPVKASGLGNSMYVHTQTTTNFQSKTAKTLCKNTTFQCTQQKPREVGAHIEEMRKDRFRQGAGYRQRVKRA